MYISHVAVIKEINISLFLIGALKRSQPAISNSKCNTIERTTNSNNVFKNLFMKCPPYIKGFINSVVYYYYTLNVSCGKIYIIYLNKTYES